MAEIPADVGAGMSPITVVLLKTVLLLVVYKGARGLDETINSGSSNDTLCIPLLRGLFTGYALGMLSRTRQAPGHLQGAWHYR